MSETHTDDVSKQPKIYRNVFIALMVLTVVTVAAAAIDFRLVAVTMAVGLAIAIVKGTLVSMYFMHLNHERKAIYYSLILTIIFFFVLILIPVFALMNSNSIGPSYVP